MLRLLLYSAVRAPELCRIEIDDVDLGESKIFVARGKGYKSRYVLYPTGFGLALRTYLAGLREKPGGPAGKAEIPV